MKQKILYCVSQAFTIEFTRADQITRRYFPGPKSFARYTATVKALEWTETRCGLGISLREPVEARRED